MTSDEDRSGVMLEALADFARANPVIVFSYHKRIIDLARKHVRPKTRGFVAVTAALHRVRADFPCHWRWTIWTFIHISLTP
jgi:hypothetical protein